MHKLLILSALVACIYAAQDPCPGCPYEDNSNSDEVLQELKKVLELSHIDEEVKTIVHVQKQVTRGMLYKVQFISESGKHCNATWVTRPWLAEQPQKMFAKCV